MSNQPDPAWYPHPVVAGDYTLQLRPGSYATVQADWHRGSATGVYWWIVVAPGQYVPPDVRDGCLARSGTVATVREAKLAAERAYVPLCARMAIRTVAI